ncbi:MAG: hypothetical protein OEL56_04250 [Nitrosopumilus sp.]|nr:hypothetical protein [Nitrosopumilus sp.]MDH3564782.1 hypothetical protein [Nitrosopumilus sp.]MDH5418024.1 hypothetical protein [Nitrosopumilus sp.]
MSRTQNGSHAKNKDMQNLGWRKIEKEFFIFYKPRCEVNKTLNHQSKKIKKAPTPLLQNNERFPLVFSSLND